MQADDRNQAKSGDRAAEDQRHRELLRVRDRAERGQRKHPYSAEEHVNADHADAVHRMTCGEAAEKQQYGGEDGQVYLEHERQKRLVRLPKP